MLKATEDRERYLKKSISLLPCHLESLRSIAKADRRRSLSEVVQVLIEREAERLLKE
jgi:hypothetical protein